jgi:hypothetical protein
MASITNTSILLLRYNTYLIYIVGVHWQRPYKRVSSHILPTVDIHFNISDFKYIFANPSGGIYKYCFNVSTSSFLYSEYNNCFMFSSNKRFIFVIFTLLYYLFLIFNFIGYITNESFLYKIYTLLYILSRSCFILTVICFYLTILIFTPYSS